MPTRKSSLYLFPTILLLLHLMFAACGFYLYTAFRTDVETRTAEYEQTRSRLRLINETQLNKNFILEVMATNVEDSETFRELFGILAMIGALASCLSIISMMQIYKQRGG